MTTVLLTGGAGFAGSHIADEIVATTDWNVIVVDKLTYAGRLDRLAHLPPDRVRVIHHDFSHTLKNVRFGVIRSGDTYVIHNGAESHVRRSQSNPEPFIQSNALGTFNVLAAAKDLRVKKFIYVSTDEVYGAATDQWSFTEQDQLNPSNPYSASKAAGEMIARSYFKSFDLPVVISRTSNMFGERQHPEKFVPMTIRKLLNEELVDVHTRPDGTIGTRQWLDVRAQATMLVYLLQHGIPGEAYNLSGDELNNYEMADAIRVFMGKRNTLLHLVNIYEQSPGHDLAYRTDGSKLARLGYLPPGNTLEALSRTVDWYTQNPSWLEE